MFENLTGYIDDSVKLMFLSQAFLIVSVVLFLSVLWFLRRLAKKDDEISRYLELAESLKMTIYTKEDQIKMLSRNDSDEGEDSLSMEDSIAKLFSGQYKLLDKLCNVYYETHDSNRDRDAIYALVKREMDKLANDKKYIYELETIVNLYKGNVISLARKELPHLSEMDFRLLCFWLAGFSAKTISVFTGDSTGNIYVKKSRLKNCLSSSGTPVSSKILEYLN